MGQKENSDFEIKEDSYYEKLGLKCGLEIHQQLNTNKLFCNCPCVIRDDKPDFLIERELRASAGESGQIDKAAAHESIKAKKFIYQGYEDTTCLVELDEEPPHEMNLEALKATIETAKLVNAAIQEKVVVMRKTVIDGSNTSGFQRTTLVAVDGELPETKIEIESICLEEDACKVVERNADYDIYNLSRLGIPLIELATAPQIHLPKKAMKVAEEIGMLLRSTGKCKRGLGTIRQDVNVSIKDGDRVEIKGAQDLKLIPELVAKEVERQKGLVLLKKTLTNNGTKVSKPIDCTHILKDTDCKFVNKGIKKGNKIIGIKVQGFKGLLGLELFPNYRLGTELAGYAKSMGFGGIIHSDENLEKYQFSKKELEEIKKTLTITDKQKDAFILALGEEKGAKKLFELLITPRIVQLKKGIPKEVRKANEDGSSTYMRPMPGASRMYPETDIKIVNTNYESIKKPKLLVEQEKELVTKYGIRAEQAKEILRNQIPFEELNKKFNVLPKDLANILLDYPKEIKKRYDKELDLITKNHELELILKKLEENILNKESVFELFVDLANNKKLNFEKFKGMNKKEVEKIIIEIIQKNKGAPMNGLMGQAMAKLRGKADGKLVMELLKKHYKQS